MNPAGFFKKYLMPANLPGGISTAGTVALERGYYHGIVFDIPGAEVKVNGQWIRCNAENADLIKSQNPMTLEWRLNGTLLRKLGYKPGDTVTGQVVTVDDEWNGLNITTDISIRVE